MGGGVMLTLKSALAAMGISVIAVSAEQVLTSCTEAALDAALVQGGRIILNCNSTIINRSTKVIAVDTILEGAAASSVTLSGGGSNRLFTINPGVTLTLRNITLVQGRHLGANGEDGDALEEGEDGKAGFGGGIFNDGGTLIASQVTFATNSATGGGGGAGAVGEFLGTNGRSGGRGGVGAGGAIYNRSGLVLLTNSTFIANQVVGGEGGLGGDGAERALAGDGGDGGRGGHGRGGAIFSEGDGRIVVVDCTFRDNVARGSSGGEPGWAGGNTRFDGELGEAGMGEGGGIFMAAGSISILRSTFNQNRVQGADGLNGLEGIGSRRGMDGGRGGVGRGGAVSIDGASLACTNSTFHANIATGGAGGDGGEGGNTGFGGSGGDGGRGGGARGGSVYHGASSVGSYVHCTFASAVLQRGTGGDGGPAGTATSSRGGRGSPGTVEGSNLSSDSREVEVLLTILAYGVGASNCSELVEDGGFNVSSDATPLSGSEGTLNNIDPLLSDLAQNGGLTQTLALDAESPARDRLGPELLVETDQRGYARNELPDTGAFEYDAATSLQIRTQPGQIVLSWPVANPLLQLQTSSSLVQPSWQPVSGAVQQGSMFVLTNAVAGSARYYRLAR